MGKFLVRITIIFTALLFMVSYLVAQFTGENIFSNFYILLFELIVVIYCYSEGKYHCKYLKYTALGILISDTISRIDYTFNLFDATTLNLLTAFILFLCMATSATKAIIHFHKVNKLKKIRNGNKRIIANKANGAERD